MNRFLARYCRLLEGLMVLLLALMVLLVFGNVVLRYAFNSGITVSEELARWMFVWLTFLGAIVALKEHGHLGTDMLVVHLPGWAKRLCLVVAQLLMLWVTWLLYSGGMAQMEINASVQAPVTGASVAIFYASGVVFAVSAAVLLLLQLVQTLSGRLSDADLVMVRESEDLAQAEELHLVEPAASVPAAGKR